MKVLVVGSGGREHALGWKIGQSPLVSQVFFAHGNAGTAQVGINISLDAKNIDGLLEWAVRNDIDLTVVGPEAPLCAGIVDVFQAANLKIFGPTKQAAMATEGSKVKCKELLWKYRIPTADFKVAETPEEAIRAVNERGFPVVVKADGLCGGKGVRVCETVEEAHEFIDDLMVKRIQGDAGATIVIEQCLEGEECSVIAITDGQDLQFLAPAQDYKRLLDDDNGPNTGGMGSYCPYEPAKGWIVEIFDILQRTIQALAKEGIEYRGALYAGLMLTEGGPEVLEFNCRFGDPETQVILPRLESDFVELLLASVDRTIALHPLQWDPKACVCVVMASSGYPVSPEKGKVISGINDAEQLEGITIFHAGTGLENGRLVTSSGRVLGVTALGDDFAWTSGRVYQAVGLIDFKGSQYRFDVGRRAVIYEAANISEAIL